MVYQTIKYNTRHQNIITPKNGAFLDANGNKLLIIKNELETNFDPLNYPANMVINGELYELSSGAFSNIEDLNSITFPKTLQIINDYAFANCHGIYRVYFPISITKIPPYCFQNCNAITDPGAILFNINEEDSSIREIGEFAFDGCTNCYSITIPESVSKIGEGAFRSTGSINDILIYIGPRDTVLTIEDSAFADCGAGTLECHATTPPILIGELFGGYTFGSISVPKELVETYKTADGWSNYADIIGPIQE